MLHPDHDFPVHPVGTVMDDCRFIISMDPHRLSRGRGCFLIVRRVARLILESWQLINQAVVSGDVRGWPVPLGSQIVCCDFGARTAIGGLNSFFVSSAVAEENESSSHTVDSLLGHNRSKMVWYFTVLRGRSWFILVCWVCCADQRVSLLVVTNRTAICQQ
jgi:hypothetical protein